MLTIADRAMRCIARRFRLYATAALAATTIQIAIVGLWHAWPAFLVATIIVPAILTTIVYAFINADAKPEPELTDGAIWSRILERCWAVIVIDFVTSLILIEALSSPSFSAPAELVADILLLLLSATFVFADTSATVDDGDSVLTLIPRSFGRSVVFALAPRNLVRALVLLTLELLVSSALQGLDAILVARHAPNPEIWTIIPLLTIATVPLSALTVLIYRDAGISAA